MNRNQLNRNQATQIRLADFSSAPMRAFHMSWLAFFLCFFSWFGIAPLMPVIRDELHLTKAQTGNSIIASVALAVFGRLLMGWLCDRIGPRKTYAWLLMLGALPVMGIGLAHDYVTFLIFRLTIGIIGSSFVVTQYHTSVMFAPNVVGTANAAAAGWGNLGGGVTQFVMPLLFSAFVSLGAGAWWGWRMAMFVPGVAMFLCGIAYLALTQDAPGGSQAEMRARGEIAPRTRSGGFKEAAADPRVWALFAIRHELNEGTHTKKINDGYDDNSVQLLGPHKPSGPFRGGKYSIYEGGTRTPFIAHWQGHINRGVSNALISQLDIMRSLATLVGELVPRDGAPDSLNELPALLGWTTQVVSRWWRRRKCLPYVTVNGSLLTVVSDLERTQPRRPLRPRTRM